MLKEELRSPALLRILAFSCAVWATTARSPAHADDRAEEEIRQGVALRRSGNDAAALPHFKAAYSTARTPRSAAQLGLCEQALGLWAEAHDHLAEALLDASDPWVKKNRSVLQQQLTTAKDHVGRVQVNGEPVGASVLVNGVEVGHVPLNGPLLLNIGRIEIELRASGYAPDRQTIELKPGAYERVGLTLERATTAAPASTFPPNSAPNAPATLTIAPEASTSDQAEVRDATRPLVRTPLFWTVIGGVVIAGAVTAFLLTRDNSSSGRPTIEVR